MNTQNNNLKSLVIKAAIVLVVFAAGVFVAKIFSKPSAQVENPPVAAAQQIAAPANPNPITSAFMSKGVANCAGRVEQVTNYLGGKAETGAVVFLPAGNANLTAISTSLEIVAGTDSAYVSTSFAPTQNGCAAVYDAVSYWPKKCDDVIAEGYKGKKVENAIKKHIKSVTLDANSKVFFMNAGEAGCVSIKKEVLF
jgi:hypothetical protein